MVSNKVFLVKSRYVNFCFEFLIFIPSKVILLNPPKSFSSDDITPFPEGIYRFGLLFFSINILELFGNITFPI